MEKEQEKIVILEDHLDEHGLSGLKDKVNVLINEQEITIDLTKLGYLNTNAFAYLLELQNKRKEEKKETVLIVSPKLSSALGVYGQTFGELIVQYP